MERVLGHGAGKLGLRTICDGRSACRRTVSGTDVSGRRIGHVLPELAGAAGGLVRGEERYAYELARDMARRVPMTLLAFGPERYNQAEVRAGAEWSEGRQRTGIIQVSTRSRNTLPFGAHRQSVGPHSLRAWGRVTRKGCGKSSEVDS